MCFTQFFPVAFYAAGLREDLRRLWKRLRKESCVSALERQLKQDVFAADPVEVLRIDVDTPAHQVELFHSWRRVRELTWYDSDVTISTRYISRTARSRWRCASSAPTRRTASSHPGAQQPLVFDARLTG